MNKPNRKFSPKKDGGERSERPRRPRSNEGSRAAGFSDKRYSPILDPDDKKVWQQRDEEGRSYRPSDNNSERPRRPRGEGNNERPNRRGGEFRSDDTRRPSRDGFEGGNRFRSEGGDSPRREGGARSGAGERSNPGRRSSGYGDKPQYGSKPAYGRTPRTSDDDSTGGGFRGRDNRGEDGRPRRTGEGRPEGRSSFGERSSGGYKGRSEGSSYDNRRKSSDEGDSRPFRRRNDADSDSPRPYNNRREGSERSAPRSEGRSEYRSSRSSDETPRATGRRGESRFTPPREERSSPRGKRSEGERSDFNKPERPSLKKKDFSDRITERSSEKSPVKTATPPDYEIDKIRRKAEKVAHTEAVIRLNKYIADAGICSRRDADTLIAEGKVKVNGEVITQMGYKVSRQDVVTFNGKKITPEKLVYVLLNKPKDFITTTEDPQERRTVMDLVDNAADQRIYPVGRLDRNTTGLLLLTNDGELAEKLSHPSNSVKKIYQVLLDKPLEEEDLEKIQAGVDLEDGLAPVDEIGYVTPDKTVIGVEIHIGRNRIVRRIFEALGYEVLGLDRVVYAGLTKKDLTRGHWRYLTQKEVVRLKHFM